MRNHLNSSGNQFPVLAIIAILFLSGCSSQVYPEPLFGNVKDSEKQQLKKFMDAGVEKKINAHNANAGKIIKTARKYVGVPHCMGGKTPKCMDCSGLVVKVFAQNGISLPHNSEEQARYGKMIPEMDKLKKGDMVFFTRSYKTHRFITHSGIYVGNHHFIHTSSSQGVTITALSNPWWNEKFIFGTRVFE